MGLFCDFYRLGQEEGRVIALQIIFDLIFLFGMNCFADALGGESKEEEEESSEEEVGQGQSRDHQDHISASDRKELNVMRVITTALYDPDENIQITSAEGFAKLFLHRIIDDKQVLEGLFYLYLHPGTPSSSPIKQCLSYFFQAYAFISSDNQISIGSLIGKILGSWIRIGRNETSNSNMTTTMTISSVSQQLFYLIDRGNLIQNSPKSSIEIYNEMYAQIAVDLSWVVLNDPLDESSKWICSIICKIPLKPPTRTGTGQLLKQLLFLQTQIIKYISDKTTINLLKRFTANLLHLDNQDDEPLEFEILNEIRAQLIKILPNGIKPTNFTNVPPVPNNVRKIKGPQPQHENHGNIMDDISDLLEDNEE